MHFRPENLTTSLNFSIQTSSPSATASLVYLRSINEQEESQQEPMKGPLQYTDIPDILQDHSMHVPLAEDSSSSTEYMPMAKPSYTMDIMFILNPASSESVDEVDPNSSPDVIAHAEQQYHLTCKKRKLLKRKHPNKAYSLEQVHFIQYCREDLGWSWGRVSVAYGNWFKDSIRNDSAGGLQCKYYRAQLFPLLCIGAHPVLDEKGRVIMRKLDIRERKAKTLYVVPILDGKRRPLFDREGRILMRQMTKDERHGILGCHIRRTLEDYFKLGDRVPELASKYRWVNYENQREARNKSSYRIEHGIVLPGAVLRGNKSAQTVLAMNAAGEFLDPSFHTICKDASGPVLTFPRC